MLFDDDFIKVVAVVAESAVDRRDMDEELAELFLRVGFGTTGNARGVHESNGPAASGGLATSESVARARVVHVTDVAKTRASKSRATFTQASPLLWSNTVFDDTAIA